MIPVSVRLTGSSEAKAEGGKLKAESGTNASDRAGSSSTPAANGNGNGHSNGHGKNGNGAAASGLATTYSAKLLERAGVMLKTDAAGPNVRSEQFAQFQIDAPACDNCGAITVRNGNCYLCHNCGNSMGCS